MSLAVLDLRAPHACASATAARVGPARVAGRKLASGIFASPLEIVSGRSSAQPANDTEESRAANDERASESCCWTAKDLVRFDGGDNFYAYAGGDPIRFLDPTGLDAVALGLEILQWGSRLGGASQLVGPGLTVSAITGGILVAGIILYPSDIATGPGECTDLFCGQSYVKPPEAPTCPAPEIDNFDDPTLPPGPGFEWRGKREPGSGKGNWHNPETGDSLHPDLTHPLPIGPHWDWQNDESGWDDGWRIRPDGSISPK